MAKKSKSRNGKSDDNRIGNDKPEFKPGDKPYYEFDGTVLNANVPWTEVVNELINVNVTKETIAGYAECELAIIDKVLQHHHDALSFRAGARLLTLHSNHYPSCYN